MGTLPRLFTSVDGDRPILASRAATLLRALATALRCREVDMCVVVLIDSGVFQNFAFRADITVLLRHVGELVDAIQVRRLPLGIFFHPNVTCDAALIEPLQHFPIAVGGIGRHPLWPPTIS